MYSVIQKHINLYVINSWGYYLKISSMCDYKRAEKQNRWLTGNALLVWTARLLLAGQLSYSASQRFCLLRVPGVRFYGWDSYNRSLSGVQGAPLCCYYHSVSSRGEQPLCYNASTCETHRYPRLCKVCWSAAVRVGQSVHLLVLEFVVLLH